MIGLTERDWKALRNLRLELDSQGVPYAEVEARLDSWIAKKLKHRAEVIAHNELVYAANRGQEMAWEAAHKAAQGCDWTCLVYYLKRYRPGRAQRPDG